MQIFWCAYLRNFLFIIWRLVNLITYITIICIYKYIYIYSKYTVKHSISAFPRAWIDLSKEGVAEIKRLSYKDPLSMCANGETTVQKLYWISYRICILNTAMGLSYSVNNPPAVIHKSSEHSPLRFNLWLNESEGDSLFIPDICPTWSRTVLDN